MKDEHDTKTGDLIEQKTRAQRFREKQQAAGLSQYAFWLTKRQAEAVKALLEKLRKED